VPDEDDPDYERWRRELEGEFEALEDGALVVGHSLGATILVRMLLQHPPERAFGAIILIAPPYVGDGDWPSAEFEFPADLGARLPDGVPVHIFQGLDDEIVPPSHADAYDRAIPQARLHRLPGRDHQLGDDMSEVADAVLAPLGEAA
jgi:pimeloyl-ACP methyl ester carboxylesterase